MIGYYKEPELTAQSFEEGYLKTGDEGFIDEEGYLTISGRIKDQFKTSKGKYISPAPIEKLLLESLLISQVCVVGSGQSHVLALCVLEKNVSLHEKGRLTVFLKEILQKVNRKLEHHEQLAKLVLVSEEWTVANSFITPTLKIKRKSIDKFYGSYYSQWLLTKEEILFS